MGPSRLFQPLTPADLKAITRALFGRQTRLLDARLLQGGLFNTTYFVKTDRDRAGLVVRVAPADRTLLFDFEKSMMTAEPFHYQLLQTHGIPSSEVVYHDPTRTVIDREFIVFRYIDAIPMNDGRLPDHAKPDLYQQLGEIIGRLHNITHPQFGWHRPDGSLPMFDRWGAFLQHFAQEVATKAAAHNLFDPADLARFRAVFAETAVFDEIQQPRLVHADLWEANVLVHEQGGRWAVAALIDIDKALFGDPAWEFAQPTLLNKDFWAGYGGGVDQSAAAVRRQTGYQLLESYMYAIVWSVQFENDKRYQHAKQNGLDALARCESF